MSLINGAPQSPTTARLLCWNVVEHGDAERCRKLDWGTGSYWLWSLGLVLFFSSSVKWENKVILGTQGDNAFMGIAQSLREVALRAHVGALALSLLIEHTN